MRPGAAFMTDVSSLSRLPATMSGRAIIASRIRHSASARLDRLSEAGMAAGSARIAKARATSWSGKAYVGTPHASVPMTSNSGDVQKTRATVAA
jgi:hypothetical protein